MSKRTAIAISGLIFAGAAALTLGATPANASDNGGGGGGGGGTNFYNPNQHYNPVRVEEETVSVLAAGLLG